MNKAEDIINECEGITEEDTNERSLRASRQLREILKGGKKNNGI